MFIDKFPAEFCAMPAYELDQILCKDRYFLQRASKNPNRFGGEEKVANRFQHSHQIYLQRLAHLPMPEYDNTLPVHASNELILV